MLKTVHFLTQETTTFFTDQNINSGFILLYTNYKNYALYMTGFMKTVLMKSMFLCSKWATDIDFTTRVWKNQSKPLQVM